MSIPDEQLEFIASESARSLLDHLLEDARLYKTSQDYMDLLGFVAQMRNFAPFNALLLQIQKPGLRFAASKYDWRERFGAHVVEDARPLLILWPFGPVALVYDVIDVVGGRIPEDAQTFVAKGPMTENRMKEFIRRMASKDIDTVGMDAGDGRAGYIRKLKAPEDEMTRGLYQIKINRNHSASVRFVTIAHELAHLFLGHLGEDKKWGIKDRRHADQQQRELEAESVAFIVAKRNGVESKSETYLSNFVSKNNPLGSLDLYQMMRAAGQIETLLDVAAHTQFDKPQKTHRTDE